MVRLTTSFKGKVATIHLDHIGVRIYISKFPRTKLLNIVVKFRPSTTTTVKQSEVLDAISPFSLCRTGCHPRELVDIEQVLINAGIDVTSPNSQLPSSQSNTVPTSESVNVTPDLAGLDKDESHFDSEDIADDDYDDEDDDDKYFMDQPSGGGIHSNDDLSEHISYDNKPRLRLRKNVDAVFYQKEIQREERRRRKLKLRQQRHHSTTSASKSTSDPKIQPDSNSRKLSKISVDSLKRQMSTLVASDSFDNIVIQAEASDHQDSNNVDSHNQESLFSVALSQLASYNRRAGTIDENGDDQEKVTCHDMIGYYRLTCFYDTELKGIVSVNPHYFAREFDEVRLTNESLLNSVAKTQALDPSSQVENSSFAKVRLTSWWFVVASVGSIHLVTRTLF